MWKEVLWNWWIQLVEVACSSVAAFVAVIMQREVWILRSNILFMEKCHWEKVVASLWELYWNDK